MKNQRKIRQIIRNIINETFTVSSCVDKEPLGAMMRNFKESEYWRMCDPNTCAGSMGAGNEFKKNFIILLYNKLDNDPIVPNHPEVKSLGRTQDPRYRGVWNWAGFIVSTDYDYPNPGYKEEFVRSCIGNDDYNSLEERGYCIIDKSGFALDENIYVQPTAKIMPYVNFINSFKDVTLESASLVFEK